MTEESQQSIECKAAIRAALEKVGEYCGLGEMRYGGEGGRHTIECAGVTIEYPEEVYQIAIGGTSDDYDRTRAIAATGWAVNYARSWCKSRVSQEGLVKFESGASVELSDCVDMVAMRLAEKIVEQTRTE